MITLKERTEKRFHKLLGQRVECKDQKGKRRIGVLEFAGINELIDNQFQVTLSNCPIWPIDPDTLKLYDGQS